MPFVPRSKYFKDIIKDVLKTLLGHIQDAFWTCSEVSWMCSRYITRIVNMMKNECTYQYGSILLEKDNNEHDVRWSACGFYPYS